MKHLTLGFSLFALANVSFGCVAVNPQDDGCAIGDKKVGGKCVLNCPTGTAEAEGLCVPEEEGTSIRILNESTVDFIDIRVARSDDPVFSANVLGNDPLLPGEERVILLDCGFHDIQVVDGANTECLLGGIDVCFRGGVALYDRLLADYCEQGARRSLASQGTKLAASQGTKLAVFAVSAFRSIEEWLRDVHEQLELACPTIEKILTVRDQEAREWAEELVRLLKTDYWKREW